jgi:hypothetical protein
VTNQDRRYLKQLRDQYERDLSKVRQRRQELEIAEHEMMRGIKHIDSVLGGEIDGDQNDDAGRPASSEPTAV